MGKHTVRKRLGNDFNEGLRVLEVLRTAMEEDGAHGDGKPYYKYKKGWSDAKVGKETGYEEEQIERFRRNRGMLYNPRNSKPPAAYHFQPHGALQKAITDLTARVAGLGQDIQSLEVRMLTIAGEHARRLTELEDNITKPNQGQEVRLGPNGSR